MEGPTREKLYIRLGDADIAFAHYDVGAADSFSFVPYASQPQASLSVNLREAFDAEPQLRQAAQAEVLVAGPVTPVPFDYFQEEWCETYYRYCFSQAQGKRVFYDSLPQTEALLLFAFPEQACRVLEETFEHVHYTSAQTAVMAHFSAKGDEKAGRRLFVNVWQQTADVCVFEQRRLVHVNSFEARSATDAAYYCLAQARGLALDVMRDSFYVAGPTLQRAALTAELRKYVANVFPINPSVEHQRHAATRLPGVPYDLLTYMLSSDPCE